MAPGCFTRDNLTIYFFSLSLFDDTGVDLKFFWGIFKHISLMSTLKTKLGFPCASGGKETGYHSISPIYLQKCLKLPKHIWFQRLIIL
jgi:hypothetical protein